VLGRADGWRSQRYGGRDEPGDFCGELVSEAQICVGAPSEVGPEAQEVRREAPSEVGQEPGAVAPSEVGRALEAERVQAKRAGRSEWWRLAVGRRQG